MVDTIEKTSYIFKDTDDYADVRRSYVTKKELKENRCYKVFDSYLSYATDLNKTKLEGLKAHLHIIDKAIAFNKKQIKQNPLEKNHCMFPGLNKCYSHRLWQAAKRELSLENNNNINFDRDDRCASQRYWIDANAIDTYGFRIDKTLDSKYQCYVEFANADSRYPNIKLNLSLSKQAYKNIDKLYIDGFDLVKFNDKEYGVRHVVQNIVQRKEMTSIDKLIYVDKWLNLYSIEVDKKGYTEKGTPYYNEDKKAVNGYIKKLHKSGSINKLYQLLQNKVSKERYLDILHRFKVSLKARLESEIGSSNEDNVTILLPKYHHKTGNNINAIVNYLVGDICKRRGLRFTVIEKSDDELNKIVKDYKEKIKKTSKYASKHLSDHTQWQDYAYALMLLKYNGFYAYLRKSRKSPKLVLKSTQQKDVEDINAEYLKLKAMEDEIYANCSTDDKYDKMLTRLIQLEESIRSRELENNKPAFV